MKKVKQLRKWGIYELTQKEKDEHGFAYAVIHPESMECYSRFEPRETDIECDTLEQAIAWVENYNN